MLVLAQQVGADIYAEGKSAGRESFPDDKNKSDPWQVGSFLEEVVKSRYGK